MSKDQSIVICTVRYVDADNDTLVSASYPGSLDDGDGAFLSWVRDQGIQFLARMKARELITPPSKREGA